MPQRSNSLVSSRLASRKWPLLASFAMLGLGLAFMFLWNPLVHHSASWDTGGDLWGIFRGAHYVGWGFVGGVYDPSTGIITFPGMAVLLSPLAMLSGHLHLTESFLPMVLPRPTAALVIQPVELLLASTVVFATDAMAERLEIPPPRRLALCLLVAMFAWPTAAVWGHAEDVLSLTFALYAVLAMFDGRWTKCGWLFGFGIAIQPLVALMLPLVVGASPRGKRMVVGLRSLLLSAVLVSVAFAGNAGDTFRALVKQPTPPSLNHATPWVSLAPRVPTGQMHPAARVTFAVNAGHVTLTHLASTAHAAILVAGGPGRSIDVGVALMFGLYALRRPLTPERLLWCAAAVLASRCFFEAVMTPYYLAPPLVLALVLVARRGVKQLWAASALALEITVLAYFHLSPWAWWLPIVAGLGGILALGYPLEPVSAPDPQGEEVGDSGTIGADVAHRAMPDKELRPEPVLSCGEITPEAAQPASLHSADLQRSHRVLAARQHLP